MAFTRTGYGGLCGGGNHADAVIHHHNWHEGKPIIDNAYLYNHPTLAPYTPTRLTYLIGCCFHGDLD
jgi:hypothetical protein